MRGDTFRGSGVFACPKKKKEKKQNLFNTGQIL